MLLRVVKVQPQACIRGKQRADQEQVMAQLVEPDRRRHGVSIVQKVVARIKWRVQVAHGHSSPVCLMERGQRLRCISMDQQISLRCPDGILPDELACRSRRVGALPRPLQFDAGRIR